MTGATLAHADLSAVNLQGVHLEATVRTGALFSGCPVASLLRAGVTPRALLDERAAAPRRRVPALHFSVSAGNHRAPLCVTRKEAATIALLCGDTLRWQALTTQLVYTMLYPLDRWGDWIPRCSSRLVLEWALAHRFELVVIAGALPHFGRVPLVDLLSEVHDDDLPAGVSSNARNACNRVAERVAARYTQRFPDAPLPLVPGITPIASRDELTAEGQRMHHCVATWAARCMKGTTFIYHVGEPAPEGSTVAVSHDGRIIAHRAYHNRQPSADDVALVTAWLAQAAPTLTPGGRRRT